MYISFFGSFVYVSGNAVWKIAEQPLKHSSNEPFFAKSASKSSKLSFAPSKASKCVVFSGLDLSLTVARTLYPFSNSCFTIWEAI